MKFTLFLSVLALVTNQSVAFLPPQSSLSASSSSRLASTTASTDTPDVLPDFASKEDYLAYMESVAALPKGFASGTANGKFVSVEAPAMGPLPIRATVIYLTEGPTENWAAVFTKNKVRFILCFDCVSRLIINMAKYRSIWIHCFLTNYYPPIFSFDVYVPFLHF